MRAYDIAFAVFLFSISVNMIVAATMWGSTGVTDADANQGYDSFAQVNKSIENLKPAGDTSGFNAIIGGSWFLFNGFNTLWNTLFNALFFPLLLNSNYGLPMEYAAPLSAVIGFIYVTGFATLIMGRDIGA